jgi:hypothetical protein
MKTKQATRIVGFSLIIIATEILFTGCVLIPRDWKTYSGPAPQGDAVLMVGVDSSDMRIPGGSLYVTSVDGMSPKHRGVTDVRLLPGKHTISFRYSHSTYRPGWVFYTFTTNDFSKDIYVEAGMTYRATPVLSTTTPKTLGILITEETPAITIKAERGHADAQYSLGWMYEYGKGVTQDYAQARDWFQKSAAQGNANAQNELGYMYFSGKGVTQDYAQARDWFQKSAAQGKATAQVWLGYMYENGLGVTADRDHAILWYRKAACQGDDDAKKNLQRLGIQQ